MTHLKEILNAFDIEKSAIKEMVICASPQTLENLSNRPWLTKHPVLKMPLPVGARLLWQQFGLKSIMNKYQPDLLFAPGGIIPVGINKPVIAMSQNLQPFDIYTIKMYKIEPYYKRINMLIRYSLIRYFQNYCFKKARGVIFLTQHGRNIVLDNIGNISSKTCVIPHGINRHFLHEPRKAKPISFYSDKNPYKCVYVSTINVYKHQWNVAKAFVDLRRKGLPVAVDFIGPALAGLDLLNAEIKNACEHGKFIRYLGAIPYEELKTHYRSADAFIFASTCETFGQVLLEAMISGLPVLSSSYQPMKELLGHSAVYFDPLDPGDIGRALNVLVNNPYLSDKIAQKGHEKALGYSWQKCAEDTFKFAEEVYASLN